MWSFPPDPVRGPYGRSEKDAKKKGFQGRKKQVNSKELKKPKVGRKEKGVETELAAQLLTIGSSCWVPLCAGYSGGFLEEIRMGQPQPSHSEGDLLVNPEALKTEWSACWHWWGSWSSGGEGRCLAENREQLGVGVASGPTCATLGACIQSSKSRPPNLLHPLYNKYLSQSLVLSSPWYTGSSWKPTRASSGFTEGQLSSCPRGGVKNFTALSI